MKNEPSVTIVIVHYKGSEMLQECLDSVLKTNYSNLSIILVDNGSSDNIMELIKRKYTNTPISLIRNENNLGFVGGNNIALKKLTSEYVVLLNNDTTVDPDWLKHLVKVVEGDQTIGACQPKLLSKKNPTKFDYSGAAGGFLDVYAIPFCRGRLFEQIENDNGQYNKISEIFWACGAAILIRSKILCKTGFFDDFFFAHMEEIDLCWRIKMIGYKIVCNPQSKVYHQGGGTILENVNFLKHRNNLFCLLKNYSNYNIIRFFPLRFCLDFIAFLKFLSKNNKKGFQILNAHYSLLKNLKILIIKRRQTQISRIVSDKQILKSMVRRSVVIQYYLSGRKQFYEIESLPMNIKSYLSEQFWEGGNL